MNKYVSKFFGIMFQSKQMQQIVHPQQQRISKSPAEWCEHWQTQGQPWRTEPEIDEQRQKELAQRRSIVPNIEQGIYPFRGVKLTRADVEWLLAAHENGRGPVDWGHENQQMRYGLDLRGAVAQKTDLSGLPLIFLRGGLESDEWLKATPDQREAAAVHLEDTSLIETDLRKAILGGAHLEKAYLKGAHLEDATLCGAHLEEACLWEARLQRSNLMQSCLQGTTLFFACLQEAFLVEAHLEKAAFSRANMEAAKLNGTHAVKASFFEANLRHAHLSQAYLEGADLGWSNLQKAFLDQTHLEEVDLNYAHLEGAVLVESHLAGAHLSGAHLEGANLIGARFNGKSLPMEHLKRVRQWVQEFPETLPPADLHEAFFDATTLFEKVHLGDKTFGTVSLVDVRWGDANLAAIDWTAIQMLGDESQARQGKTSDGQKKTKKTQIEEYETATRANRQLAIALENQGLNEDAKRFALRACNLQRRLYWKRRNFWRWFGSAMLALLAGYGYQMWRILVVYLFVVLLCATAYFVLGLYYEPHLSFLEAVLTSITAFHGRVFSEPFAQPGEPQLWVTAFEAVAGLVIEGVFIAMLTQKFFGK
jgi:uncharacterized protein YjbI with pentapeptide repeats